MAIKSKTIIYGFETYPTSVAGGTLYEFSGLTAIITEPNYTIENAFVQISVNDNLGAAASMTGWLVGALFNGVGPYYPTTSATTNATTITNSGENQQFVLYTDLTREFKAQMTTSATTIAIRATFNTIATIGRCCKLYITYSFDDTNVVRSMKTAIIPIGGNTSYVATTPQFQPFGIPHNIPTFNTLFPESNKEYYDIFFEIFGNDATSAATNFNATLSVTGDSNSTRFTINNALNSAKYYMDIWKYPTLSAATSGNNINTLAMNTSLASRFTNMGALMYVTYSYDEANTTRVLNSIQTSTFANGPIFLQGTTANLADTEVKEIVINEPGTINIRQSGFISYFADPAGITLGQRELSQPWLNYTVNAGGLQCGQYSVLHRIDPLFTASTGTLSLTNGLNRISLQNYATTAAGSGINGILYLNYESGKSILGSNAHNKTIYYLFSGTSAAATRNTSNFSYNKLTDFYLNDYFVRVDFMSTFSLQGCEVYANYQLTGTTENFGASGWTSVGQKFQRSDNELGFFTNIFPVFGVKKYSEQYNPRMFDWELPRNYRTQFLTTAHHALVAGICYHEIPTTFSGTLVSYTGTGSGINVDIYDKNNLSYIKSASTITGGVFSTTVYDNNVRYYAVAYQSDERKGVSDILTPASGSSAYDIVVLTGSTGTTGGESFYAFC